VTKIVKSRFKACRRLGVSLWDDSNDAFKKRNYRPGQHGAAAKKLSDYGRQLQAKQKLKGFYGGSRISEKQFRRYFFEAVRRKGDTGENLIALLESRIDTLVYRLSWAPTIFAARQLVSHKHVKINGVRVNIASHPVKPGDVVELMDSSKELEVVKIAVESSDRPTPSYVEYDETKMTAKMVRRPQMNEVIYPCQMSPQLVVEYYSH